MSHFSTALRRILESRCPGHGGQTQFARHFKIDTASLSRYLLDDSRPDVASLDGLCSQLDHPECAELAIAYLRDYIPPSAADFVQLSSFIDSPRVEESPRFPRLPGKIQAALEMLATAAEHDPVAADAILSIAALLRKDR